MDGFLFIDKPTGPSSFAVINQLKPLIRGRRIGHAGTLDPAASGLLIVAVGKATRLLEYVPAHPKAYTFTLRFGSETDTLDDEGVVVESGGRIPNDQELQAVLPRFLGTIGQEPPRFSAVKIDGQRAYARARRKESFTVAPREVTIESIALDTFEAASGTAVISTRCSAGTYIRSLARDIARALGTFGFALNIRRTAIGPFSLNEAKTVDTVAAALPSFLVSTREVFKTCSAVSVSDAQKKTLSFGADLRLEGAPQCGENRPLFACDDVGEIVAVLKEIEDGRFHPVKVFL
jgi:tRNA pseudouridine55 synthase